MRNLATPRRLVWALFVVAVAVAMACGGSTIKSPTAATTADNSTTSGAPTGPTGNGTVSVSIKDKPLDGVVALLVTFDDVSVHASGDTWVKLPFDGGALTRTCDLMSLKTAVDILGVGTLAAGHYTQLRLSVSSAKIFLDGAPTGLTCAATIPDPSVNGKTVVIPSGVLKLNREFDLATTATTSILVDFDADQSVKVTGSGKSMMTPVINIVSVQ